MPLLLALLLCACSAGGTGGVHAAPAAEAESDHMRAASAMEAKTDHMHAAPEAETETDHMLVTPAAEEAVSVESGSISGSPDDTQVRDGAGTEHVVTESEETADETPPDPLVFKLASTLSEDIGTLTSLREMAEEVYAGTDGRVDIQLYPSSRLGDQVDYLRGIQLGTVEMCLVATVVLESIDPHFVIFGAPGLFHTPETMNAFYESALCQEMLNRFRRQNGIRVLGLYHDGIRNLWLKEKEITTAEELQGLRLRVPEVEIRKREFSALGAETIPLPLSDCRAALQSGFIDGMENNVETIVSSNIADQIRYQIVTEHAYSTLLLLVNEQALGQLTEADRETLTECVTRCGQRAYADYLRRQEAAYVAAEDAGILTVRLEKAEKDRIDEILFLETRDMLDDLFQEDIYAYIRNL